MEDIFGKPVHTYTRREAIEDGYLVDVSTEAAKAGFKLPTAIERDAWLDCVLWSEEDSKTQTYQDQSGRLWDVLFMCSLGARINRSGSAFLFKVVRVPRDGESTGGREVVLRAEIGPGDDCEPVITISLAG